MKRILHCITTICRGGAENQLLILTKAQILSGRKVTVVYLKGVPELKDEFFKAGVEVLDILANKNIINQIIALRNYIKSEDVIVHAHLPRAELISALSISDKTLIISKHNAEPFFPKAPKFFSRLLALFVSYKSSACIAISHSVAKYLKNNKEIMKNRLIEIVYYGYKSHYSFDSKVKAKNEQNFINKNSKLVIGTVARLVKQKDLNTLIRAFEGINKFYPASELHIVGKGKLESQLKKLAFNLGISEKVFWRGNSSNIFSFYSELDFFILTSRYEGFGLVLLEAIDANIPVIASNNSAIIEVLGEKYEYFFETGNHKDLLIKFNKLLNLSERSRSADYCRQRLHLFSVEIMLSKIDKIYNLYI